MVPADGLEAGLKHRRRAGRAMTGAWARYALGRFLQVAGLTITLMAATAFFGTPSTIAMLRMMLVGVLVFVPGWMLARKDPRAE